MKSCLSTLQIRKCGCADAHSVYDKTVIVPICDILENRKIGNHFYVFYRNSRGKYFRS